MITPDLLNNIAARLAEYRGNGRGNILFDTRDRGNYSELALDPQLDMLQRHDPTGLAMGMMLREMIEITIAGSNVRLKQVLLEPGFVEHLRNLLAMRSDLDSALAEPMATFMRRLNTALQTVSPAIGMTSSREVTCCLRDAIFCMDQGLQLRWLQCEDTQMALHVDMCTNILQYPDAATFADALRYLLPWGAHLVRIGHDHTCIGIKQPGRIAYLSSLVINARSGSMQQNIAQNAHIAEQFDLDIPVQRYPQWFKSPAIPNGTSFLIDENLLRASQEHKVQHIAQLPGDRLLWLAMVVELATQRMAATEASSVELAEIATRALGIVSPDEMKLPAVIQPNWRMADMSLAAAFDSLALAEWERRYLEPALTGLSVDHFLPLGNAKLGLNLETRTLVPWIESKFSSDQAEFQQMHATIVPAHADLIGTRHEIETARRTLMKTNLAGYLLDWGNRQFNLDWAAYEPKFKCLLAANALSALRSRCAELDATDYTSLSGTVLYTQSSKHTGYRPCCFFNGKKAMTHRATLRADNSADLVMLLGLDDESALPVFLRGWSRQQSWTTDSRLTQQAIIHDRWCFMDNGHSTLEHCQAKICLNAASVPEDLLET